MPINDEIMNFNIEFNFFLAYKTFKRFFVSFVSSSLFILEYHEFTYSFSIGHCQPIVLIICGMDPNSNNLKYPNKWK